LFRKLVESSFKANLLLPALSNQLSANSQHHTSAAVSAAPHRLLTYFY